MLAMGVFFDLLPVILIFVAVGLVIMLLGDTGVTASHAVVAAELCESTPWYYVFDKAGACIVKNAASVEVVVSLFLGGATAIFLGPFIYTFGSFLSTILAYFFFTVWFYMKGVHMWTFTKGQRVLVNLCTVVVETIPLLNLLPGITFMVWRHVAISQAEDAIKDSELQNKAAQQMNKLNKVRM